MRDVRRSGDSPPMGAAKRTPAGKVHFDGAGQGSGLSRKLKDFEARARGRLIPSNSESDEYLISLRHPRNATDEYGTLHSPKSSERTGVKVKSILLPEKQRCGQNDTNDLEKNRSIAMERKMIHDLSLEDFEDDAMPIKKIRLHPLNAEKDKSDGSDAKKVSLDSVRFSIGKALIRASRVPGPRQAAEDDGSLTKRPILARLEGNGCPGAVIEHSSPKMLKTAKYGVSSSDARQCSVSGDGRGIRVLHNDEKFKDQDEIFVKKASEGSAPPGQSVGAEQDSSSFEDTGFIKKLGSSSETDKTRSLQNSGCSERRGLKRYLPSEDIKTPKKVLCNNKKINGSAGQPINAEQGSSFFEGRKSLKKLGSSSVTDKIRKSPRNSRCSEKRPQKQYFPTEDKKTLKKQGSLPSSSRTVRGSLPSPSLSKDQKYLKKSSPLKLQKSQMRLSNFSSADESKVNMHDSLPPKIESDDENDFCNTGYNVTEASRVMTKAPLSSENDTLPESASRRTEKQTLRDQIKGMLLCAGWKIEMKRRKGKKYEDSVYVSPEGIGYWSITKAYGVLKEQINKIDELGNKKGCPGNSNGLTDQFSVIPTDMLGILKRKIVKNRRFIGAEKFVGSKKTKCVTSSKSAKMKKVVAVKKEINENGIVGSSRKKNKNRRGCALLARNANQETDSEGDNYVPYAGRRSVLAWLLDSGTVPLNGKVKYMNKRRTWVMLEGLVTRDGILCKCCSKTLTVSKFEIHAGSKQKQPYENIFLEGLGISLLECQLDAWKKQEESKRCPSHLVRVTDEDPNDDTCGICGDGGNLICCDSCPATFHLSCLGIQTPPPGDWHCMNCLCRFCGRADSNTSDGHSLTGSLLLSCGQCGEKYHQVCMPDLDAAPVNTNHLGLSFCGQSCRMLFAQLQNLIGIKNDLEGGFSWTLVRRFYDDSLESCSELAQRVECNSKIAVALSVMDECFLPIIDQRSGINLITNVLYNCGSNFSRLDYQGFYTFILEQGDEILSAASIRIHGKRLAEMPFIGTRHIYRRQGMCRRLLNAIEEALGSLKIEKLVIPAISELMHTWTVAFGFEPLSDSDMQEIRNMNMLVFPGTGLLQKHLLRQESCAPVQGVPVLNDASLVPDESSAAHDPGEVKYETVVNESGFSELHGSAQATAKVSYQLSDPSCDAPCRSGAGEIGLKPLETAPDGESSIQCDTDSRDEENGKCASCIVPSTEPETEDPACGAVEIRSQVNGHLPGAYPVDTPVLPCSPVVSGAAVLNNKPWNDRDLSEHRPEVSCGSAPVLHNPTVSDMHMMHGICSKKEEGCTLADSAPGADCWA